MEGAAVYAVVDGETIAEFTLLDARRQKVAAPGCRVEAHMTHPGMAPLIEPAANEAMVRYVARLRFPMAGGWMLFVKGELADRRPINQRLGEVTVRARWLKRRQGQTQGSACGCRA